MAAMDNSPGIDELGKMLADRAGLNHNSTSREWTARGIGKGTVHVEFTTHLLITDAEFNELHTLALRKAQA